MPVRESDLKLPALASMAGAPSGFITTSALILELESLFEPEGLDAALLANRKDSHFSQKVRNLVSHRHGSTGLEARGLAIYSPAREGWTITDYGRERVADFYD